MTIGKVGRGWASVVGLALSLALVLSACSSGGGSLGDTGSSSHQFGVQTQTSGCQAHNGLPDSACTPGAIIASATVSQICQSGYASSVRNVPTSEKDAVYAEYGIHSHYAGQYEVDHLVSLELGGSNDIANLSARACQPDSGLPSEG